MSAGGHGQAASLSIKGTGVGIGGTQKIKEGLLISGPDQIKSGGRRRMEVSAEPGEDKKKKKKTKFPKANKRRTRESRTKKLRTGTAEVLRESERQYGRIMGRIFMYGWS